MNEQTIRLLVPGILLAHGLGHGGAMAALAWIAARPGTDTGAWSAARSWLVPGLPANAATAIACGFWTVALVGFVLAAAAYAGILVPAAALRPIAIASAIVSLIGIVAFAGTWPMFNTVAAVAVNVGVLIALLQAA